jgi:hypothetical protein
MEALPMLPNRWHHGHSLAAGTVFGIVLAGSGAWLLFALGAAIGAVVTLVLVFARRLLEALSSWLRRPRYVRRFP